MSPILYACNLCGWTVADSEGNVSWLNQFRGLVSDLAGDIDLTGIGLYDDVERGSYIAPLRTGARWDDPGYEQPEEDEFGAGRRVENGRYGFIFHASCWALLEQVAIPTAVPHAKLYAICMSLPRPLHTNCVSWGHDYGGLVAIDNHHYFPWEGRETQLDFSGLTVSDSDGEVDDDDDGFGGTGGLGIPAAERLPLPDDDEEDYQTAKPTIMIAIPKSDPLVIPEINLLLSEKPEPPPRTHFPATTLSAGDRFFKLPEEIRTRIALFLPTTDALNARLASKSFWYVFDSHQFWISRFRGSAERSWLFEATRSDGFRDWRWLYRRTTSANLASLPAIQNRLRVWDLARKVTDIWGQLKSDPAISSSTLDGGLNPWTEASGDVKSTQPDAPYVEYFEGCRTLHRQRQNLSRLGSLCGIGLSFIQVGVENFLSGIRFISCTGKSEQIGYLTESEQVLVMSTLTGFMLALGSRGIHAVQCLTEHHHSPWYGDPDDSPKSGRLATQDPITALEVGFDGFKIVSLSLASTVQQSSGASKAPKSLRNAGIWYPDIPGPQLCLNEDFYVQREHHMTGYRPLIWTLFGGPRGIYLRNLTGLAVHVGGTLPGIEFKYNNLDVPNEYTTLGRHQCDRRAPGCKTPWEFAIDGPGGERIDGIEIYLTFIDEEDSHEIFLQGALESFKVFTSHGRSFHFRDEAMHGYKDSRMVVQKFKCPAGTQITGFYTRQFVDVMNYGMATLGIITEEL